MHIFDFIFTLEPSLAAVDRLFGNTLVNLTKLDQK